MTIVYSIIGLLYVIGWWISLYGMKHAMLVDDKTHP